MALLAYAPGDVSCQASDMLWELPYVQHVQLAVGNLQEILYLQCFFDGKQARCPTALVIVTVTTIILRKFLKESW